MHRVLALLLLASATVAFCSGQAATRIEFPPAFTVGQGVGAVPVLTIPNAAIKVCNYPAIALPCTNVAATYTGPGGGTACPSVAPLVLSGTNACVGATDTFGNSGIWGIPGKLYAYTITDPASGMSYGPYSYSAPLLGGVPTPTNAVSFGADPSRSLDSTVAINLAFAISNTVMLPPGNYLINGVVNWPANSELILYPGTYTLGNFGQFGMPNIGAKLLCPGGPENTFISVPSTYAVTSGVIYMSSGEPAGTVEGCQIDFAQPDTSNRASLTHYAAYAIEASGQPRAQIRNVKIERAWNGIDLQGNSGGSIVDSLSISSLNRGINIDGAFDSIRINNLHWYPFGMTANQITAFTNPANIGVNSGRCDDLHITNSLFFGGLAINLYTSSAGLTFGNISGVGFDTGAGIAMASGYVNVSSVYFSPPPTAQAVLQTGGTLTLTGIQVLSAGTSLPLMQISGAATFNLSNSVLLGGANDITQVAIGGDVAEAVVTSNQFNRISNITYGNPTIAVTGASRLILADNYFLDKGTGTSQALTMAVDSWSNIHDNELLGWSLTLPVGHTQLSVHNNIGQGP